MKGFIGYIRVSTVKQGTKGVSLIEQRDAILRYAERNHLPISIWFEEMETAAKLGRPEFNRALKLLRTRQAQGIILHKLDRGARNLRDWAAIGELADSGVEVHFVNESLDLQSRGGRLSADIQAVVAADYIRNLREETRKGFYGRLKQGFYPLRAPLGYVDQGKGKAKTIDPVMGALARQAFQLYASARYNLDGLGEEMYRLGLRNKKGGRVTRNGLSTLLNNPFYIGIILIQKTGQYFDGLHEPLIGKVLFNQVQAVLSGKINTRCQHHMFIFRRLLSCATCRYSLIGEKQKGYVYYRCHTKICPKTSIREEIVLSEVEKLYKKLNFHDDEKKYFTAKILEVRKNWRSQKEEGIRNLTLQLNHVKDRLNRITDAYIDGALDKVMFEERKKHLLVEQKHVEENLTKLSAPNSPSPDNLKKFLEQAENVWLSHKKAFPEEKREMLKVVTSNREVSGKKLDLKPSNPFHVLANRGKYDHCDPKRTIPRMWDMIIEKLGKLNDLGELPDLSALEKLKDEDIRESS